MKLWYKKKDIPGLLLAIITISIFAVIEGCRYQVGSDWHEYQGYYTSLQNNSSSFTDVFKSSLEPLFMVLNYICVRLCFNYQGFFALVALLQVLFITFAMRKIPQYLPIGMALYALDFVLQSQNIIRQCLSTTIFIFGLSLLANKKKIKYIICSCAATFTHYSSFITLPFVCIGSKFFKWIDNKWIAIISLVLSFGLGKILINIIMMIIPTITSNAKYISNLNNLDQTQAYNSGLGLIFNIVLNVLVVFYFPNYKKRCKEIDLTVFYRTFVLGTILSNAFANSIFLARVPFALTHANLILYPIFLTYLWNTQNVNFKLLSLGIFMFKILGYFMTINSGGAGSSPFLFDF